MTVNFFAYEADHYEYDNVIDMQRWMFRLLPDSKVWISVIRGPFSYGGPAGLFECWVGGESAYATEDPKGNYSLEEVNDLLRLCYEEAARKYKSHSKEIESIERYM